MHARHLSWSGASLAFLTLGPRQHALHTLCFMCILLSFTLRPTPPGDPADGVQDATAWSTGSQAIIANRTFCRYVLRSIRPSYP
eukprot:gene9685-6782_t